MLQLGSCDFDDIACSVLVRVLTHAPDRNEFLINGGFLALSQQGFDQLGGTYAKVGGHPELKVYKMTQEIGFVRAKDPEVTLDLDKFPVGSTLKLYQYHNCDTANKYKVIYSCYCCVAQYN